MVNFEVVAYHHPQQTKTGPGDTHAARTEGAAAVRRILHGVTGAFAALADWNSHGSNSLQDRIAKDFNATVHGTGIDAGVLRGLRVVDWKYMAFVGPVKMESDHKHTLRIRVKPAGKLGRLRRAKVIWWYNLREGRSNAQMTKEVNAMLANKRTLLLGTCEAVGYTMPVHQGYHLVRDKSNESRANIAVYVRRGHMVGRAKWHDMAKTWARVSHPGQHAPRSFVSLTARW